MKTASAVWACLLAAASMALADGVVLNGVTARSIGRGGANIASSDNIGLLLDNPAAAVNIDGAGMSELSVTSVITQFHYSDPDNPRLFDTRIVPLPQMGLVRKSEDGQWAYGLGVFAPAGFSEKYAMQGPAPLDGLRYYSTFGALVKVLPGVAYRVTDRLSVGGTLGVGISYISLKGPYFIQGPSPLAGTPTMLDTHGTGAAMVWSFGMQFALTEATSVGVTYQSESRFHLDGNTHVAIPAFGESSYKSKTDITWPQSVGMGVRHALCPCRIVSADVIWYNWSQAFDDLGIHLSEPSNQMFPPLNEQVPLNWRDTVSMRLGYERILDGGRTLRFGYVYHRDPIPESTLTPYIQATLEHGFSAGYGWTTANHWNID
ncbi:MAG: outer membrane protein transport protein, partial [Patescibacteria group bacterium]|nr:outer membrane protein transport protein [Patescibacteria group bacterium]